MVPVLAQSSRCGRAPSFIRRCQRVGVEQLAVGAVGAAADRDAEPVAQLVRHLVGDGDVPAADEERGDRGDVRVEPGLDPPLDPAHVGVGGGEVLLGVEEQGDVDRDAGEDRLLDRRAGRPRCRGS